MKTTLRLTLLLLFVFFNACGKENNSKKENALDAEEAHKAETDEKSNDEKDAVSAKVAEDKSEDKVVMLKKSWVDPVTKNYWILIGYNRFAIVNGFCSTIYRLPTEEEGREAIANGLKDAAKKLLFKTSDFWLAKTGSDQIFLEGDGADAKVSVDNDAYSMRAAFCIKN
jgi:hypothetical protein